MSVIILPVAWVVCTWIFTALGLPELQSERLGVFLPLGIFCIAAVLKNHSAGQPEAPALKQQPVMTGEPVKSPMAAFQEYREPLPSGGELAVTPASWSVQYFFPVPGRRNRYQFVKIEPDQLEEYKNAWKENYATYCSLKYKVPEKSKTVKKGRAGMSIRWGAYPRGVCLRGVHIPVSTDKALAVLLGDYDRAAQRGQEIKEIFLNPAAEKELRKRLVDSLQRCLQAKRLASPR